MRRVLSAFLLLVGLGPATLHAARAYAVIGVRTDVARSYFGARYYASGNGRFTTVDHWMSSRRSSIRSGGIATRMR